MKFLTQARVTALASAIAVVALGLAGAAAHVQRASAHASYASSNPSDKQVLAMAPSQLTITFVSNIVPTPGTFATVTCNGNDAATGRGAPSPSDPTTLVVPLQPNLPNGKCIVFWKSTDADDGGVTFGTFSFFIGNASASDVAAAQPGVSVAVPDDATDDALTNVNADSSQGPSAPSMYVVAGKIYCTDATGGLIFVAGGTLRSTGASCP